MNNSSGLKVIFFALSISVLSLVHAAESPDSVLALSASTLKSAAVWSLDFQVDVRDAAGKLQSSSKGSLLLGSGDRFRLRIPGQEYTSDGISLWQYTQAQKQVLIKSLADLEGAMHPSEALFRYLRCKPVALSKAQMQGKTYHLLKLDPAGQMKGYTALDVWLTEDKAMPVQLAMKDGAGSVISYRISNLLKNPQVTDSDFKFKSKGDIEEIDMR